MILKTSSLSKSFQSNKVVDGFSAVVEKGELVTIIGPSGCGKSTLLRCLNGLEEFESGKVTYSFESQTCELRGAQEDADRTFSSRAQAIRKKVGMVFQSFNLFPHLNLLENMLLAPKVLMGARPGSRTLEDFRTSAHELIEKVGLSEKTSRFPRELSGGEQQRAAIARAMLLKPEVLLYDEPTSALDPSLVQEVLGVMKNLKDEGLTQIVVTHEMNFAREAADRVLVMNGGRLIEAGSPHQVFTHPQHEMTQNFLKSFRRLLGLVLPIVFFFASSVAFFEKGHAAEGELRWAADAESGAPFVFRDAADSNRLIGFEVELIEAIAVKLGRKAIFVQNNWEGLIEGLRRRDYDVVINGIEITDDRKDAVRFSTPYYVTSETLTVRKNDSTIASVEDLGGKRVGTLSASLAKKMLADIPVPLEIISYSEELHAYNDLSIGRLDAVFLDQPVALYYARPNLELRHIPTAYGKIEYGIALLPEATKLAAEVDRAISELSASGQLAEILKRWGLWNKQTADQFAVAYVPIPLEKADAYQAFLNASVDKQSLKDRLSRYVSYLPLLLTGAATTLKISLASIILAVAVGLLAVLARLYGGGFLQLLTTCYIEAFRGTPLLIQLFLIFYGLPHLGIRLEPFWAAVIGLGLNYGACEAENYRAGILSVPKSQFDAARALGLSHWQSLRHVVLPQALRVALPPSTNDFIALLKDSSLVSVITMVELTSIYGQLASANFDYLGLGLLTALVYFLIGLPFVRLSRRFDKSFNY